MPNNEARIPCCGCALFPRQHVAAGRRPERCERLPQRLEATSSASSSPLSVRAQLLRGNPHGRDS